MHNIFLYDNKLDLGIGQFASVGGFKLISVGKNLYPEAIQEKYNKIYGYIYEVDDGILDMLDIYYGLGVSLHERINVKAALQGGIIIHVEMYEYNIDYIETKELK